MRLGIMMSFQCRADLGESWEKAGLYDSGKK